MKRSAVGAIAATSIILATSLVVIAQSSEPTHRVTFGDGATADGILPITIDTIPTTTQTSTTATTLPPTTTEPPTTTTSTTIPSSTTSTLPPIPDYINLGTLQKGEGYEITVDDITNTPVGWWDANYFFDLPYQNGYGWAAGDRCAYRSAYGFLLEGGTRTAIGTQWDLNGGTPIGMFEFVSIRDGTELYIRISDGFMVEGSRHIDGTLDRNSSVSPEPGFDECHDPNIAYESYTGPSQTPVVAFRNQAGEVVEVRDYAATTIEEANIVFQVVDGDGTDGQVAVTAHDLDNAGLPGVVVYYTALGNGTVELVP